jgi:hypothetical protein
MISRHGPRRKYSSFLVVQLLPWEHVCLRSHYLVTAVVYLLWLEVVAQQRAYMPQYVFVMQCEFEKCYSLIRKLLIYGWCFSLTFVYVEMFLGHRVSSLRTHFQIVRSVLNTSVSLLCAQDVCCMFWIVLVYFKSWIYYLYLAITFHPVCPMYTLLHWLHLYLYIRFCLCLSWFIVLLICMILFTVFTGLALLFLNISAIVLLWHLKYCQVYEGL